MNRTPKSDSFLKYRSKLGKNIQKLRKERNLSQEELASIINMDRVAIGYIEQGIRSPKLETIYHISKALKVSLSELFDV